MEAFFKDASIILIFNDKMINRMFCKVVFCFLLALIPCGIYSQTRVSGHIVDENSLPMDAVSVMCYRQKDSVKVCHTYSNAKGDFTFTVDSLADYMIRLACVGYESQNLRLSAKVKKVDLGYLKLKTASIQLKEVAVEAQRSIHKVDRTLLFPTKEQLKYAFNGYNVLYNMMIPDLDVDPFTQEIKKRNVNAVLCINGREVEAREVEQLDPRDIRRIDYYDMHPEYPMKPVLDFILIDRNYGGSVSTDNRQVLTRMDSKYNVSAQVFHNQHEFTAGITDKFKNYTQDKTNLATYDFLLEDGTVLQSKEEGDVLKNNDNALSAHAGYLYKTKATYLFVGGWINTERPETNAGSTHSYSGHVYPILAVNESAENKNLAPGGRVYYTHTFQNRNKLEVGFTYNYASNAYLRNYKAWNDGELYAQTTTDMKERFYYYRPSITYRHNFEHQLSLWAAVKHLQQTSHSTRYRADGFSDNERNQSCQTTSELTLTKQWNKWMMMFYCQQGLEIDKQEQTHKQHMYHGTWSIKYVPNQKHALSLFLAAGHLPVEFRWKTGVEQEIDFMQVKKGNPDLQDIEGFATVMNYSWLLPWGSLAVRWEGQRFLQTYSLYTYREDDKFVHTYYAGGQGKLMFGELRGTVNLIPRILTLKLSGGYRRVWNDSWWKDKITTWLYGANLLFTYHNWMASANIRSHQREDEVVFQDNLQGSTYNFNIGYVSNSWNVSLGFRNPFSHPKNYRRFTSDVYKENTISYSADRMAFLTVSYRFRFGKKHKFDAMETETINNSAILKADD